MFILSDKMNDSESEMKSTTAFGATSTTTVSASIQEDKVKIFNLIITINIS
jgi:hypothetical protein